MRARTSCSKSASPAGGDVVGMSEMRRPVLVDAQLGVVGQARVDLGGGLDQFGLQHRREVLAPLRDAKGRPVHRQPGFAFGPGQELRPGSPRNSRRRRRRGRRSVTKSARWMKTQTSSARRSTTISVEPTLRLERGFRLRVMLGRILNQPLLPHGGGVRGMIRSRVMAGLDRAKAQGKKLGRPRSARGGQGAGCRDRHRAAC